MKAKYILLVAIAALLATTMTAKKQSVQKIYIYGMAATFTDTIVYFTPIQEVDSAWVDAKTTFLQGRENYSYQLREYLTSQQMPHRTCIVVFNKLETCCVASFLILLLDLSNRTPIERIKIGRAISRMPRLSFKESDWRICLIKTLNIEL